MRGWFRDSGGAFLFGYWRQMQPTPIGFRDRIGNMCLPDGQSRIVIFGKSEREKGREYVDSGRDPADGEREVRNI